ncbi:hypothetical protein [Chitinophaga ginsengisoli]|uniref:Uncharacterized protein n=1 Tax=Chitinophaga ginsengisoli TaxID=363837 RepID=A0A2P8G2R2_9BACT|nr:hypothetical protein [Chitinophaga ginsengisoli]PSL28259.1 hypothetical protein CLV42_108178 [Chitinophaga ginsengisoli]
MKIGRQFKTLTLKEYLFFIDNHKKYTDFNTLGLYRSIVENEKLTIEDKLAVRDYAHQTFKKSFDFLQIKDPQTYVEVSTLGQELTRVETKKLWEDIRRYQQKTITEKRFGHRNFGVYSKHSCGYDTCHKNGVMIKQGSYISEGEIYFGSDKNRFAAQHKSEIRRQARKKAQQMIRKMLESE